MTIEYFSYPDSVVDERPTCQNASVASACPIHLDLGWRRDTERGQT